ncbi:MAG: hypothetical protein N2560_05735 [Ignavibacteria bacterium]|nr:hypothetical protein [Ignavibacteria bacterium]
MNICILQLGTYGDMILTTPIITAIKNKYPSSKINFIAGGRNYLVVKHHPDVSEIIIWNKLPHRLINNLLTFLQNKFDYYVDPKDHYSTESQIIARLVRAKVKIGLNYSNKKTFDITIPNAEQNEHLHFTQRVFQAFKYLDIPSSRDDIPKPVLFYPEDSKKYLESFLLDNGLKRNSYIVFNISASNSKKTFSEYELNQIFTEIVTDIPIVLTFDVNDTIKALNLKGKFRFLNLFFSRTILDIFAVVNNALRVITPDTSLVHIATAYSKSTLAFYSGLDNFFNKFHPNNPKCIVVRAKSGDDGIHSIPISLFVAKINSFINSYKEVL